MRRAPARRERRLESYLSEALHTFLILRDETILVSMTTYDENGFLGGRIKNWITTHKSQHRAIMDRARELNHDCHHFLSGRAVPLGNGKTSASTLLFARMLELYQSIILINERGMVTGTRILFRAFIEASFHFFAIYRDSAYLDQYMNQFHIHKKKLLRRIRKSTSAAMAELRTKATDKILEEMEQAIVESGAKEIHISEVAERADMYDTYLTAYAMLSPAVHTAVSDIDDYILVNKVTGETEGFNYGPSDKETRRTVCLIGMTLAEALDLVSQSFSEDRKTVCEAHKEAFRSWLEH